MQMAEVVERFPAPEMPLHEWLDGRIWKLETGVNGPVSLRKRIMAKAEQFDVDITVTSRDCGRYVYVQSAEAIPEHLIYQRPAAPSSFGKAPENQKYPYEKWFDGHIWKLTEGEDFVCKPLRIAEAIRKIAERWGESVQVITIERNVYLCSGPTIYWPSGEVVDSIPPEKSKSKSKYPYDKWLDGNKHILVKGQNFESHMAVYNGIQEFSQRHSVPLKALFIRKKGVYVGVEADREPEGGKNKNVQFPPSGHMNSLPAGFEPFDMMLLLDGSPHHLVKGKDYHVPTGNLIGYIKDFAEQKGMWLPELYADGESIHVRAENEGDFDDIFRDFEKAWEDAPEFSSM